MVYRESEQGFVLVVEYILVVWVGTNNMVYRESEQGFVLVVEYIFWWFGLVLVTAQIKRTGS